MWISLATICALSLLALGSAGAREGIGPGLLGKTPPDCGAAGLDYTDSSCTTQTRNGTFSLSAHIARPGELLTGTITNRCVIGYGNNDPCPIDWDEVAALGKHVSGCGKDQVTCTVRIAKNAPSSQYRIVTVYITNAQGTGISKDYYAVVGKDSAVIEGKVLNKNHDTVPGVEIEMIGGGSAGNYTATTGADGTFSAEVTAGRYRLTPSAASLARVPPKFSPTQTDLSVAPGGTSKADFTVDVGLVVKLTLSKASVPANGFAIVKGTIEVTEFGKPKPGVTVALWPKSKEDPDKAVRTGTRATICAATGRIWPTGTLLAPAGDSVNVVTDANGKYEFTLDVGTVPGEFDLTAWAREPSGKLITADTLDSADDQTLTLTPTGRGTTGNFVRELGVSKGGLNTIPNDPAGMAEILATLVDYNPQLGGLAYGVGNGAAGGGALVVYPADKPPVISDKGALSELSDSLVLSPALWAGPLTQASLSSAIQAGDLQEAPTYKQWASGAAVQGWKLSAKNSLSVAVQTFQYFGWPYPPAAGTTGACS